MAKTRSREQTREMIAREHAAVQRAIREVVDELDWLCDHAPRAGEPWDLPLIVDSFHGHLKRHFELEENGGPLDLGRIEDSSLRLEVARLLQQHRAFSLRVEFLLVQLGDGLVPEVDTLEGFEAEIRSILSDLREHEANETRLLRRILGSPPAASGLPTRPWF